MSTHDSALQEYQDETTGLLDAYRIETLRKNVVGSLQQLITRIGIPFAGRKDQVPDQPPGSENLVREAICTIVDITPDLAGVEATCHDAIVQALWSTMAWQTYLMRSTEPWKLAAILISNVGYLSTGKDTTQGSAMNIICAWTGLDLRAEHLLPEHRVEMLCERFFGDVWWVINPVSSADAGPRAAIERPPFLAGLTHVDPAEGSGAMLLPVGLG